MPLGAHAAALCGAAGFSSCTPVDPTVIDTSTTDLATAHSNQRKLDRCQNGVLWAVWMRGMDGNDGWHSDPLQTAYSTDDGETWTLGGTIDSGSGQSDNDAIPNCSFFIDVDDYAHVVMKDQHYRRLYYRWGTPNAARTAWTWSVAFHLVDLNGYSHSDIVVHPEGSGWRAHVVASRDGDARHVIVGITSDGTITQDESKDIVNGSCVDGSLSIDFHHTGDGKTVADGTPHLFVAWSAGATGSGNGIRFKKATYSGGSWTWGTEREIDSGKYADSPDRWLNCLFDGTRVIIGGHTRFSGTLWRSLYERDAADTTTIEHFDTNDTFNAGSLTYDADGNVYFIYATSSSLVYQRWVRSTGTFEAEVTIVESLTSSLPHVSAKRGYFGGPIEFVYTDGTDPYDVNFASICP